MNNGMSRGVSGGKYAPTVPGVWTARQGMPTPSDGNVGDYSVNANATTAAIKMMSPAYGPKTAPRVLQTASYSGSNQWATVTTATDHGLLAGDVVTVAGTLPTNYLGTWVVAFVSATNSFTYAVNNSVTTTAAADTTSTVTIGIGRAGVGNRPIPATAWGASGWELPSAPGWAVGTFGISTDLGALRPPWQEFTPGVGFTSTGITTVSPTALTCTSTAVGETLGVFAPYVTGKSSNVNASTTLTAPTEATGEVGFGFLDNDWVGGVFVTVKNDNKLRVYSYYGALTLVWTSTTTATSGAVALSKLGTTLLVSSTAWGAGSSYLIPATAATAQNLCVYLKGTTVGKVSAVNPGSATSMTYGG